MGMVLCWVMVYSGGHEQCHRSILGFRAVLVGVAGSPGALLSPGVLVGVVLGFVVFSRRRLWLWRAVGWGWVGRVWYWVKRAASSIYALAKRSGWLLKFAAHVAICLLSFEGFVGDEWEIGSTE
jgi:hypothetical protein